MSVGQDWWRWDGTQWVATRTGTEVVVPTDPEVAPWVLMPIRSEQQFNEGDYGGEAEQHLHSMSRSLSHPDIIYVAHDVAMAWRSDDNGNSWRAVLGKGLMAKYAFSIAVDPVNPNIVYLIVNNRSDWTVEEHIGMYRSTDGGDNWVRVIETQTYNHRFRQKNIAYAPSTIGSARAETWYAAFQQNGVFRSTDGGVTWSRRSNTSVYYIYQVAVDYNNPDIVFMATTSGLLRSTDGGSSFSSYGGLPSGGVTSVEIHSRANTSHIYVTVNNRGVYRSTNSGESFSEFYSFADARYTYVHPGDDDYIVVIAGDGNSHVTNNGGSSWSSPTTVPTALAADSSWKNTIGGGITDLSWDPRRTNVASCFSRATIWRTEDSGATFVDSSNGFTGYAWGWFTRSVAFDPVDPLKFATFNFDVGLVVTESGADHFVRRRIPWSWQNDGLLRWRGIGSGDIQPGSNRLIAAVGLTWTTTLVRSDNLGDPWLKPSEDEPREFHLFVRYHTVDPNVVYAGPRRSLDGGVTWSYVSGLEPWDDSRKAEIIGMAENSPDTIYAISGDRRTHIRSDDRGNNWYVYSQTSWRHDARDPMPTFAIDSDNPDRIYGLMSNGDLGCYEGESWTSLNVLSMAGGHNNYVRRVVVDPSAANVVYAGTSQEGRPFVFRSIDYGETWEDITRNLPRHGIRGVAVHPITGDFFTGGHIGTRVLPPPYESPSSLYPRIRDAVPVPPGLVEP